MVDSNRLIEVRNGLIVFVFNPPTRGSRRIELSIFGIQFQRLRRVGDEFFDGIFASGGIGSAQHQSTKEYYEPSHVASRRLGWVYPWQKSC